MAPTALAYLYVTAEDIEDFLSLDGSESRLDDDSTGALSVDEQRARTKALSWATARVNLYCLPRYDAVDLATSWVVNQWAVVLACHWLSCRRGNPPPGSFDSLYKEAMEDLKAVRAGDVNLADIGLRTAAWPAWSNVRVDILYRLRKIRVEKPISEHTPQRGPFEQFVDIPSQMLPEPNSQ